MNVKNSNFVVHEGASLKEAMVAITANHRGAVLVADVEGKLIGVVSDGDIRRAMLRGSIAQSPVRQVLNYNVISIGQNKNAKKEAREALRDNVQINIIPVIDGKNKIVDLVIRNRVDENQ